MDIDPDIVRPRKEYRLDVKHVNGSMTQIYKKISSHNVSDTRTFRKYKIDNSSLGGKRKNRKISIFQSLKDWAIGLYSFWFLNLSA